MIELSALALLLLFLVTADWGAQKDWEMLGALTALVAMTVGILLACSWKW